MLAYYVPVYKVFNWSRYMQVKMEVLRSFNRLLFYQLVKVFASPDQKNLGNGVSEL